MEEDQREARRRFFEEHGEALEKALNSKIIPALCKEDKEKAADFLANL